MAIENGPFIGDFPLETSSSGIFQPAMVDSQRSAVKLQGPLPMVALFTRTHCAVEGYRAAENAQAGSVTCRAARGFSGKPAELAKTMGLPSGNQTWQWKIS